MRKLCFLLLGLIISVILSHSSYANEKFLFDGDSDFFNFDFYENRYLGITYKGTFIGQEQVLISGINVEWKQDNDLIYGVAYHSVMAEAGSMSYGGIILGLTESNPLPYHYAYLIEMGLGAIETKDRFMYFEPGIVVNLNLTKTVIVQSGLKFFFSMKAQTPKMDSTNLNQLGLDFTVKFKL